MIWLCNIYVMFIKVVLYFASWKNQDCIRRNRILSKNCILNISIIVCEVYRIWTFSVSLKPIKLQDRHEEI